MTGKDLLISLGDISHKYYEEAEKETIAAAQKHRTFRRPLLIAALIALTALLVGCAVVYALRLQDMSVGKKTYTQRFDDKGRAIEPTEKTMDILTIYGHSGDPIQLALKEWYDFLETYDPDGALATNNPAMPDIPDQYEYIYSCYTQDMVDKVDEIAEKHGLKLLENRIPFQRYQSDAFLEATGIGSFVLPDSGAETRSMAGMLYEPCNFSMEFELVTDKLEKAVWLSYDYARKDYFPRAFPGGLDLSLYEQWDHTAPDGTPLLLALSNKGHGFIIAQRENAMLILSLNGNFSGSAYPAPEEIITKEELEAVADLFDYSIQPRQVDRAAVEQKLADAQAAYDAANAYVPETYDGFSDYLMQSYPIPKDDLLYTFYDITGDGEDELLLGRDGAYLLWVTNQDGETLVRGVIDTYLCQGGVEERCDSFEIYETHMYLAPVSETVIDDIDAEREILTVVKREGEQWYQGQEDWNVHPITAEEARAAMAQYLRVELDWKPLMDYPLNADGQPLGSYIEAKNVPISEDALLRQYKDVARNEEFRTHYRILDINGDGVNDLLLSGDGEIYWTALTYRYGSLVNIGVLDFYLCQDGVLECVSTRNEGGVVKEGHEFIRRTGFQTETLAFTVYNKATASWQGDWYGDIPMTEEEANAILAKYPRIDQGMRPISELLN